ncbi:hypothetical protein K474DRAFT_1609344, partial [Panus rudis PR-1116 ss-1]
MDRLKRIKQRHRHRQQNPSVRAAQTVTIPPESVRRIPVNTHFAKDQEVIFVEKLFNSPRNIDDAYAPPDLLIRKDDPFLHVANFSSTPVVVKAGQTLGISHDPAKWLDKLASYSDEQRTRLLAHASLVQTLAHQRLDFRNQDSPMSSTARSEVPDIHTVRKNAALANDIPEGEPVEGGPKTAEAPPEDVASQEFPSCLDLAPELDDSQRADLLKILSKHERAFSLDGRLGTVDANCTIPLRPGAREVSLPPFPASPAKREVI